MSRLRIHREDGALGLLTAILEGTEDLGGAACRGLGPLFDPDRRAGELGFATERGRARAVEEMCRTCPVRARCWAWAREQKGDRLAGPTAATVSATLALRATRADRERRQDLEEISPSPVDPHPPPARPGRPGARRLPRPSRHRRR